MTKTWVSAREAADLAGRTQRHIYTLCKTGVVRSKWQDDGYGRERLVVNAKSVEKYIAKVKSGKIRRGNPGGNRATAK